MDIYFAGGYNGNLNPLWSNVVQILSRGATLKKLLNCVWIYS